MKKVLEKRKDIAFFIKMFPLPMHKNAYDKSKAILCGKNPAALLDDAERGHSSTRRMSAMSCARWAVKRAASAPSMTRWS